ncbi:PAS domain S-box protein [Aromatoleum petrolei]|uniref:histidine kinase n=2 Tax=Aromatoleum petrolei TaxID=76116 RepID=A0ABX1MSJ4_9RHOO|nr:PAS domain S-box protein [Aromatoleum petrolei]
MVRMRDDEFDAALNDELSEDASVGYEAIFRNTPVAICHLFNRRIRRCNRRYEILFGYERGELDNQSVRVHYPSDESFATIGRKYGHFFERDHTFKDERPFVRKDGTLIWCIVTGTLLDPANPKLGSIWVVQDISEHKRIEEELKADVEKLEFVVQQRTVELSRHVARLEEEVATRQRAEEVANENREKYQKLFHMLPIGISITDTQGTILEANCQFAEMVGLRRASPENWRKLPLRFFLHDGTEIPRHRLPWQIRDFQKDSIDNIEIGMRDEKGRKLRWLSVSSSLIERKDEQFVVAAFTDITYRKRIEELERLRHAELTRLGRINSMAEMAAALAHQMGQPLVSAVNYLNGCRLRLERVDGVEEISESMGLALKYLEQAGEILRHVKEFVCKHKPDKEPENINEVIQDALSFLNFEVRRHDVSVDLRLLQDPPLVPLCKVEIQQVLFNLMKNGMEAMTGLPPGARKLVIGSEIIDEGGAMKVFVQDHGTGLEKRSAKRVFEPYFSTKPDGMGIGLTICRSIVESHGGQLSFSRIGKGGSRFQFTLPM